MVEVWWHIAAIIIKQQSCSEAACCVCGVNENVVLQEMVNIEIACFKCRWWLTKTKG